MPAHRVLLGTIAGLAWLAGAAQAQVVRCTDARTGQVSYTDGACPSGSTARQIEARKSPEELRRERQQAADALERKQQQQAAEAEAARQEALKEKAAREAQQAERALAPAPPAAPDYARSPECARARQTLQTALTTPAPGNIEPTLRLEAAQRQVNWACLGPEGYAEIEKARASQPRYVLPSWQAPIPWGHQPRPPFPAQTAPNPPFQPPFQPQFQPPLHPGPSQTAPFQHPAGQPPASPIPSTLPLILPTPTLPTPTLPAPTPPAPCSGPQCPPEPGPITPRKRPVPPSPR